MLSDWTGNEVHHLIQRDELDSTVFKIHFQWLTLEFILVPTCEWYLTVACVNGTFVYLPENSGSFMVIYWEYCVKGTIETVADSLQQTSMVQTRYDVTSWTRSDLSIQSKTLEDIWSLTWSGTLVRCDFTVRVTKHNRAEIRNINSFGTKKKSDLNGKSNFYHLPTLVKTRWCTTAPFWWNSFCLFWTFIFFIPYRPIYLYCAAEHMAELFSFSCLLLSLAFAVKSWAQWKLVLERGIVGNIIGGEKTWESGLSARLIDRCSERWDFVMCLRLSVSVFHNRQVLSSEFICYTRQCRQVGRLAAELGLL